MNEGDWQKAIGIVAEILKGEFFDLRVIKSDNLPCNNGDRVIAILHEDEIVSLCKQFPYSPSPGSYPQTTSYCEDAVARKIQFLIGKPVEPSEFEKLRARNAELESLNIDVERRISTAVEEWKKKYEEADKEIQKTKKDLAAATENISFLDARLREKSKLLNDAASQRDEARKDLTELKESVARVMLLVPKAGESSVKELIDAEKVSDILSQEGRKP